ncbi:MAG: hypothetical protein HKN21_15025 [Candidatus Eisenbacteria bacterium]|uniref:NfeD-like C-terminal domain-containing protein n=1 Tax=Eiseniibacteriota bacterium TaxID=2212470 RepID=A0A7Y2H3F9_UNCEI|nr:hypothetical protein [Candidatus Eisenbacteria bacterium]
MFESLFNWSELVSQGVDVVVYAILAGVGTLFFLVRLAANAFLGGGDLDMDTEFHGDSDHAFGVFSLLSILAFFMAAGWMGLACRLDWALGRVPSAFIASGFGFVMMLAASGLTYLTRRLNQESGYDIETARGVTGRVYLSIPAKGTGQGQVEVSVSGRKKIIRASSNGDEIPAFTEVKVIGTKDDESVIVEPTGL